MDNLQDLRYVAGLALIALGLTLTHAAFFMAGKGWADRQWVRDLSLGPHGRARRGLHGS